MNKFIFKYIIPAGIILCALIAFLLVIAQARFALASAKKERDYQYEWCKARNGLIEVTLQDRSRVDCLTKTHAIEFDFAKKWAEAPFQALHYARLTGKLPGVVIICRTLRGRKNLNKLIKNLDFYKFDIAVWNMGCEVKEFLR